MQRSVSKIGLAGVVLALGVVFISIGIVGRYGAGNSELKSEGSAASSADADPGAGALAGEEAGLNAALVGVKAVDDPWKAFIDLCTREAAVLRTFTAACPEKCEALPSRAMVKAERRRLLGLALERGNRDALVFLYGGSMKEIEGRQTSDDDYSVLRNQYHAQLLVAADRAGGGDVDGQLLFEAGELVAGGQVLVKDTSRAVGYYARAWAAGAPKAADRAAVLFHEIKDTRNAYLWSLRCVGSCARSEAVELTALESELSADAIKQAQRAAADQSIVELDSGA